MIDSLTGIHKRLAATHEHALNNPLNPDRDYVFREGVVRYGITGRGPDLVLVHGTPWSCYAWHKLVPELAKNFRVHFYDLIGYGASEKKLGQNVSLDVQTDLLCELLQHWELKTPSLVAHDFGGAISLRAHLLAGVEYRNLSLINVVALAPWGSPFFAHVRQHEAAFSGVPDYIHQAIVETYIAGACHAPLAEKELQQLVAPWLGDQGRPAFYRQIAQADQQYTDDVEPLYAGVRCPTSVIWGVEDQWIPIETGKRLHTAIAHSKFYPIAGAGHLAAIEQPEALLATLGKSLGE